MTESPIRRGQLIHTFGVGSLYVTNDKIGLISGGLDYWFKTSEGKDIENPEEFKIEEKRLAERLGVNHFMLPPDFRQPQRNFILNQSAVNLKVKIPFLRFPGWHYCINRNCRSMRFVELTEATPKPKCNQCNTRMVQLPLVAICQNGHISEFPWNEFVHRSLRPTCNDQNLQFRSTGVPSLAGQLIHCKTCNHSRTLQGSLGFFGIDKGLKYPCSGERPWLGGHSSEPCTFDMTGSLRSSSRVYFAKTTSSIYIPDEDNSINPDLLDIFEQYEVKIAIQTADTLLKSIEKIDLNAKFLLNPDLIKTPVAKNCIKDNLINDRIINFSETEIDDCLKKLLNQENDEVEQNINQFGTKQEEEGYRNKEYNLLLKKNKIAKLETIPMDIQSYGNIVTKYFKNITLVNKLVETSALYGFSRVQYENEQRLDEHKNKLRLNPFDNFTKSWLPASQTTGEGFFLEIREDILEEWEKNDDVINRTLNIKNNIAANLEKSDENEIDIDSRIILIHTISHLLINQLVFDCGYGASSIKERLYTSVGHESNMSGLLIYTSGGDSEGTMGGLVRMGRPGYLEDTLLRAIMNSSWCSVDPVCTEIGSSTGQGPNSANLAACHNCALVPETSCEMFNSYLDRVMVTGHYKDRSIGFMGDLVNEVK